MSRSDLGQLDGCVAVVTGASSGIGRATALELAAAGADVLVHAANNQRGAEDTAALVRDSGRQAAVIIADFAVPHAAQTLATEAWDWRGAVDIWVNNAGADVLTGGALHDSFDSRLERLWRVDVAATVQLSRRVGARMKERGNGNIVTIGWDQAESGMAGDSAELFAICKGAIMAFTRSLAKSLAPEVRVNCVAPGWIKTAWGEQAGKDWQDRVARDSLLQRWGEPVEVARLIRFLVSPLASYVNGQVIAANGGRP